MYDSFDFSVKQTKGELAFKILALVVVGGVIMSIAVIPGLPQIARMFGAKTARDRYRIKQSLRALEKRGFVASEIRGTHDGFVLTDRGRKHLQRRMLEKQVIQKQKKWDGVWRVLMFDIPEEYMQVRREVSMLLREMGMMKIQNSVFASPYPCHIELDKISRHYDTKEYFVYLETRVISNEKTLMKFFKIGRTTAVV